MENNFHVFVMVALSFFSYWGGLLTMQRYVNKRIEKLESKILKER